MSNGNNTYRFLRGKLLKSSLFWSGLLTVLLLLLIAAGASKSQGITLRKGSRILIADVRDQTGERDLAADLRQLLCLSLDQSGHFHLYPESRLRESVQMLATDARSPVTEGLALQICSRENISAFLLPSLSRAGRSFVLSVRLAEIRNNRILRKITADAVRADDETDLLFAADDLAKRIRRLAGEAPLSPTMAGDLWCFVSNGGSRVLRLFAQADVLAMRKDHNGEMALLRQAVALEPRFALARMQLGALYIQEGRLDEALQHVAVAKEHSEGLPPKGKHRTRAAWYGLKRDYLSALREHEALITLYPDDWRIRSDVAEVALQMCNYARSVDEFKEAIRLDDSRLDPYLGLTRAEMFNRDAVAARRAWERAQALDPEDFRVMYAGAQLDLLESNVGSAIRTLEKMANASPPEALSRGRYLLAQALIYGGRFQAALDSLDSGIAGDRERGDTLSESRKQLAKAQIHALLGNAEAALEIWKSASQYPMDPATLAYFGSICTRTGQLSEAREILARLEKSSVGHAPPHYLENLRGEIALTSGRIGDAIDAFSRAKGLQPGLPPSEALARAFAESGRFAEAANEYRELRERKAESLFPADAPWFTGTWVRALFDASRCFVQIGKKPDSQQYLRNYLWALDGADRSVSTIQEAKALLKGR